jgi:hypothetical protein
LIRLALSASGAATVFVVEGCSPRVATAPEATATSEGRDAVAVDASNLRMECGRLDPDHGPRLAIRSACTRAVVGVRPRAGAALSFSYRGPSRTTEPLASGELRRQIGLKLRAQNTCNVVYVMWHVAPTIGVHVSIKSNPNQRAHSECGDRGYINLPGPSVPIPAIHEGESHTLEARIDGEILRVNADGALVWQGHLPPEAFAFNGPVGIRSDNGDFDAELRVLP